MPRGTPFPTARPESLDVIQGGQIQCRTLSETGAHALLRGHRLAQGICVLVFEREAFLA
jgi:hypothetical protein